jgi:regulator of cell morphogenesis and NO signaling
MSKTKNMSSFLNLTLADLAIHEPNSISIFEKYDLDFYKNGTRTLQEACLEKGLDDQLMNNEFLQHEYIKKASHLRNFDDLDIEQLISHLEEMYHAKETFSLSLIHSQFIYLKEEQSYLYPEMHELDALFQEMMTELKEHAAHEEKVLFPYVKKMAEMRRDKRKSLTQISLITNPLNLLEFEHENTDSELSVIRKITNNYYFSIKDSEEYSLLMIELSDFEKNFHKHIHLENNVLFPKIRTLESELFKSIQNHI